MKREFHIDIKHVFVFLFYASLLFLSLALSVKFNIIDYDLWARLINGAYVVGSGNPMYRDIVSYAPTHTWYDPEWLSSTFFYLVHAKFGIIGLTLLKGFLVFILLCVISFGIKSRFGDRVSNLNIGYYLFLLAVFSQSGAVAYTIRCQLFSFIFVAIWVILLEKIRRNNNIYLFFLPLVMMFWLNIHAGCIAGVGILFLYGAGEFLNKKPCRKYFITLFFVCLMFFINPWGISYIKFILQSAFIDRCWIAEWQSPFVLYSGGFKLYKLFLLATYLVYGSKIYRMHLKFNQINKTKLLVLVVLTFLSICHIKHLALFMTLASIYMYDDFYQIYNLLMEKVRLYLQITKENAKKLSVLKNIFVYVIIFSYSTVVFILHPIKTSYYRPLFEHYPAKALNFIDSNNIKGKILTPFYFGSYIAYKYYPNLKIYMDGRQEQVYSTDTFDNEMFFFYWLGKNPQKIIELFPPDIILFEKDFPCYNHLQKSKNYKKIYEDEKFVIFIKKSIQKFSYKNPKINVSDFMDKLFDTKYNFGKAKI